MEEDELELRVSQSDASLLRRIGLGLLLAVSMGLCVIAWLAR